jgi:sodium/proline symporter
LDDTEVLRHHDTLSKDKKKREKIITENYLDICSKMLNNFLIVINLIYFYCDFMQNFLLIAFFGYFAILSIISFLSFKKQMTATDFIIGNRSLNFWVTALSAHASDMSSWLFMAFPAAIYVGGLSQSWIAIGLLFGMFLNWQFVAKKLRTSTEMYESTTLSTFFEKRFDDSSGIIRLLTAIMAIVFLTCYVAAGLIGMGGIFESVFGIDFYLGLTVSTCVIVFYTFAGGFITVAWTDLFQALFLLCMIVLVPTIAFFTLDDGIQSIVTAAHQYDISLSFFPDISESSLLAIPFLVLSWGLGYFGQPHIVTKFMGIKNADDMNKSKYLGMTWQLIALAAAACIGLVSIPYFAAESGNPELIFVEMVKSMFHPLTAGFILCGVLAASMSTMDSQILVCASVLSEDLYKHLMHKKATPKELLIISRAGVVLISLISLYLAFNRNTTILEAVLYAWSGLGSSFGPLVLMSLYSKKANRYGAIAGILTGGVVSGTWGFVNDYFTAVVIPAMIPGFLLSLLSIYVVSLLTQKHRETVERSELLAQLKIPSEITEITE